MCGGDAFSAKLFQTGCSRIRARHYDNWVSRTKEKYTIYTENGQRREIGRAFFSNIYDQFEIFCRLFKVFVCCHNNVSLDATIRSTDFTQTKQGTTPHLAHIKTAQFQNQPHCSGPYIRGRSPPPVAISSHVGLSIRESRRKLAQHITGSCPRIIRSF